MIFDQPHGPFGGAIGLSDGGFFHGEPPGLPPSGGMIGVPTGFWPGPLPGSPGPIGGMLGGAIGCPGLPGPPGLLAGGFGALIGGPTGLRDGVPLGAPDGAWTG